MSKFNALFDELINGMEISECGIYYNKRYLKDYSLKLEQERDQLRRQIERAVEALETDPFSELREVGLGGPRGLASLRRSRIERALKALKVKL